MSGDPFKPLEGKTAEQIEEYLCDHLVMATRAAYLLADGEQSDAELLVLWFLAKLHVEAPSELEVAALDEERRKRRLTEMVLRHKEANHA